MKFLQKTKTAMGSIIFVLVSLFIMASTLSEKTEGKSAVVNPDMIITIDPSTVNHQASSYVVGTNRNNVEDFVLALDAEPGRYTGYYDDMIDQYGSIVPRFGAQKKLYRLGGSNVDGLANGLYGGGYHFQQEFGNTGPYANDDINYFIDEAAQLNADMIIGVNIGSGTIAEAVALVQYFKDNNLLDKVAYFEMGNELMGNWQKGYCTDPVTGIDIACTPEDYASYVVPFIDAMKLVDSNIKIAVCGSYVNSWEWPNCDANQQYCQSNIQDNVPEIFTEFFNTIGDRMDYIAYHAYMPYNVVKPEHLTCKTTVGGQEQPVGINHRARLAMAVTEWSIENRLEQAQTLIDQLRTTHNISKEIKLVNTEYGTAFETDGLKHTITEALYTADNMLTSIKLDIPSTINFCLYHYQSPFDIDANGNRNEIGDNVFFGVDGQGTKPVFYTHKIIAENMGSNVINATINQSAGIVDVVTCKEGLAFSYDKIALVPTKDADGTIRTLIVNRSETDVTIEVNVLGGSSFSSTIMKSLAGTSFSDVPTTINTQTITNLANVVIPKLSVNVLISQAGSGCQTDVDGDGICANEDCDDNDGSVGGVQPQFTPCNDNNPNTSFDMIQADGCTCLGTDCGSGGATQFSGCNVIVEVDGQDVKFVSTTETGTLIIKVRRANWSEQYDLCNDYNNNTECSTSSVATVTGTGTYVVDVQGGTGCSTFNITVGGGGGGGTDADNDSVCDLIDCDDNDASIGEPQPENTPCDDGDSNTTNDVIQDDGCTCEGTTSGCQTDVDGDGICANEDCDDNDSSVGAAQPQYTPCNDNNPNTSFDMIQADGCTCLGTDCGSGGATQFSGCNVIIEVDGQDVKFVSTTETGTLIIKVRRANWSEQYDLCNDYNNNTECSTSSVATVTGSGTYVIDVQGGTGCSTFNITVGGGGGGGTDADNDSVCDLIDCDDNDASVGEPQPEDTPCDDGDSNTTNDVILDDGCTCEGTTTGCQTDVDGDGICANEDCDDNDSSVGAIQPQYTPCNDNNPNTSFDMIQADGCTCLGTDCGSGATQFSGCNVIVEVDGQDVKFVSTTETGTLIIKVRRANWSEQYDLCNDYNNNTECSTSSVATVTGTGTYVIDIQGGTGCSSFNITVGGGGGGTDADNDSVCDLIDCDDNDASVGEPQPAGTSCDDGNPGTTNDVIMADGCTCQGSTSRLANTSNSASSINPELANHPDGGKTLDTHIDEIKIYPNPADNLFYIDLRKYAGGDGMLEIYNQLGQRQLSQELVNISADPINVDLSGLTSGIYILMIQVDETHKEIKQFVVIDRQ